jgi:hypothetical protein
LTPTEAIRRLAPSAGADEAAHATAFRALAELLLDGATLHVARRPYRFTELELYYHGFGHLDPGRARAVAAFDGELSTRELCALFGASAAREPG